MKSVESVALMILISAVKPSWGTLCSIQREVPLVILSPESFFGSTSIFPGQKGCSVTELVSDPNAVRCNAKSILFDDDLGPTIFNLDEARTLNRFVGWSSESYMMFDMGAKIMITAIDISIVNFPSRNLGLPNIQIYSTIKLDVIDVNPTSVEANLISYDYLQNEHLSRFDHTVKTITLRPRLDTEIFTRYLLIRWTFTGLAIERFALSEIKFCQDIQPRNIPQPIQFQIPMEEITNVLPSAKDLKKNKPVVLTCTIANSGLFTWKWLRNGEPLTKSNHTKVVGADGTRTATLTIFNPSVRDSNVVYFCQVSTGLNSSIVAARQFITLPLILINPGYRNDMPGVITCEAYGYIQNINAEIAWTLNGYALSSKFRVNVTSGSDQLVSFDGRSRNSIISTLEVLDLKTNNQGFFECSIAHSSELRPETTLEPFSSNSSTYTATMTTLSTTARRNDTTIIVAQTTPTAKSTSLLTVGVSITGTIILLLVAAAMFFYTKRRRIPILMEFDRFNYFCKTAPSRSAVSIKPISGLHEKRHMLNLST